MCKAERRGSWRRERKKKKRSIAAIATVAGIGSRALWARYVALGAPPDRSLRYATSRRATLGTVAAAHTPACPFGKVVRSYCGEVVVCGSDSPGSCERLAVCFWGP